jgi:hypothetical protein
VCVGVRGGGGEGWREVSLKVKTQLWAYVYEREGADGVNHVCVR